MNRKLMLFFLGVIVFTCNVNATTLHKGLQLFNKKEFYQAKAVFKSLANQGDSQAEFWLGVTQFRTGEQSDAGQTFLSSAEAGNPWAMLMIVPSKNGYCRYLNWPCDESWMSKALDGWKNLAKQGNGKAKYALLKWSNKPWWSHIPFIGEKKYTELVKEAVISGGYRAPSNMSFPMDMKDRVDLLQYAASHGYAPAMVALYRINEDKEYSVKNSMVLMTQALNMGYVGAATALASRYRIKLPAVNTLEDIRDLTKKEVKLYEHAYYYGLIAKSYSDTKLSFIAQIPVFDDQGKRVLADIITPVKQRNIESKASQFLNKVKPNMFLDESSGVSALLN